MTKEKILKKVIEKAIKNGYIKEKLLKTHYQLNLKNKQVVVGNRVQLWQADKPHGSETTKIFEKNILELIFSNDFAKAFWGEQSIYVEDINPHSLSNDEDTFVGGEVISYQYHLQQMVLEEDRIKYLEKSL